MMCIHTGYLFFLRPHPSLPTVQLLLLHRVAHQHEGLACVFGLKRQGLAFMLTTISRNGLPCNIYSMLAWKWPGYMQLLIGVVLCLPDIFVWCRNRMMITLSQTNISVKQAISTCPRPRLAWVTFYVQGGRRFKNSLFAVSYSSCSVTRSY